MQPDFNQQSARKLSDLLSYICTTDTRFLIVISIN